jgi:hypothetical protein
MQKLICLLPPTYTLSLRWFSCCQLVILPFDVNYKQCNKSGISVASAAVSMANWQQQTVNGSNSRLKCCHIMDGGNITLFWQYTHLNDLLRSIVEPEMTNVTTQQVLATLSHQPSLCLVNTAHLPPLLLIDVQPSNTHCGKDVWKQLL